MISDGMTFEEHLRFLNQLTALQLHYLWRWMRLHPDEDFREALRNRTDLCRKTDPAPKHYDVAESDFKRSEWIAIENEIAAIYEDRSIRDSAMKFEGESLSKTVHLITKFAKLTYGSNAKFAEYQCGSLRYNDPPPDGPSRNRINFHIGNAIAPKSIFQERSYLVGCFTDMMDQTEKKFGGEILVTRTWLNSLPKWLEYFPQEWIENLGPEDKDVQWHFGFWGQFVSARGALNMKYAKILRETGEFPFWPRISHCSFKSMRKHLAGLV